MNGDPADLIAGQLDLADVHARAHLQPDLRGRCGDRFGTPNGAGGTIERREEPVARAIDLATAMLG